MIKRVVRVMTTMAVCWDDVKFIDYFSISGLSIMMPNSLDSENECRKKKEKEPLLRGFR